MLLKLLIDCHVFKLQYMCAVFDQIKPVYNPLTAKPEKVSREGEVLANVERKRLKLVPLKFEESSSKEFPRDVESLKKTAVEYVTQVISYKLIQLQFSSPSTSIGQASSFD